MLDDLKRVMSWTKNVNGLKTAEIRSYLGSPPSRPLAPGFRAVLTQSNSTSGLAKIRSLDHGGGLEEREVKGRGIAP
jgi:hypothetical protein